MKIAIAGTGYVGIVTAACLAEKGHQITCIDIDENKIKMLQNGKIPVYETGLAKLIQNNSKSLMFTVDYKKAYKNADVIFIAVGTPEKKDGSANLKYIFQVVKQICDNIKRNCVIVVKSTVPIGTNEKIEKYLKDNIIQDIRVSVVSNPEFLSQGTAVNDTLHASRIIIGIEDRFAKDVMLEVYKDFDAPKLITNRRSAEMIKYASNDFLALKISYINEIANLCEEIGADIEDVAKGMGYDDRIGNKFLNAGIGYGGSCFPKDTKALHWLSNFHDHEIKTIKAAIEVNDNQKLKLIKKAKKYYNDFQGLNIAVLGITFKPNTDDLRESPALVNIPIFLDDGASVKVYDPVGEKNFKEIYNDKVIYCKSIDETIANTDICFIFTDWNEIKTYDINKFEKLMKKSIVIDGRNCYKIDEIKKYNLIYESIGRKTINGK